MSDKVQKPLGDIGNTVRNKDARNVFERLVSPQKRMADGSDKVVWKPASRVSPKKSEIQRNVAINETPRRLSTPPFLKEYNSRITQSLDRPGFDSAAASSSRLKRPYSNKSAITDTPTTNSAVQRGIGGFLQPISPTKITFSNEKQQGGDGSSSRILSRIRNIRASPLRPQLPQQQMPIKKKNLTEKLKEEEEGPAKRKRVRFQMPNQPTSYQRPTSTESICGSDSSSSRAGSRPGSSDDSNIARIRTLEHTVWSLEARVKQLEEVIAEMKK